MLKSHDAMVMLRGQPSTAAFFPPYEKKRFVTAVAVPVSIIITAVVLQFMSGMVCCEEKYLSLFTSLSLHT